MSSNVDFGANVAEQAQGGDHKSPSLIPSIVSRAVLATLVAAHDGFSWIKHSKGQIEEFITLRRIVDAIPNGLNIEEGLYIAMYLGDASKKHDVAEENIPRNQPYNDELLEQPGWDEVEESLQVRYLLLNGFKFRKLNPSSLPREISVIDPQVPMNERVQMLEVRIGDKKIIESAKHMARLETELWVAHHVRDYDVFKEKAIGIFLESGYPERQAVKAADQWIFSCKQHDAAEKEGTPPIMSAMHWIGAGGGLIPFYYTLIGGQSERV